MGDDVEVGANSCIDRGTVADTTIGDGTKIDNLVQIGHNVKIGRTCLICGLLGSGGIDRDRRPGRARRPGLDRRSPAIGSNSVITGNSGVTGHVAPGRIMMGYPAVRMDQNVAIYKALRRLPRLMARLEAGKPPQD